MLVFLSDKFKFTHLRILGNEYMRRVESKCWDCSSSPHLEYRESDNVKCKALAGRLPY